MTNEKRQWWWGRLHPSLLRQTTSGRSNFEPFQCLLIVAITSLRGGELLDFLLFRLRSSPLIFVVVEICKSFTHYAGLSLWSAWAHTVLEDKITFDMEAMEHGRGLSWSISPLNQNSQSIMTVPSHQCEWLSGTIFLISRPLTAWVNSNHDQTCCICMSRSESSQKKRGIDSGC